MSIIIHTGPTCADDASERPILRNYVSPVLGPSVEEFTREEAGYALGEMVRPLLKVTPEDLLALEAELVRGFEYNGEEILDGVVNTLCGFVAGLVVRGLGLSDDELSRVLSRVPAGYAPLAFRDTADRQAS